MFIKLIRVGALTIEATMIGITLDVVYQPHFVSFDVEISILG